MDRRVPAVFALCVALLLVANPLYALPHAGQQEYYHDVERVAESDVPAEADVLRYENLSPEAKAALRDARTDDGVVYGQARKPPEFFYSDYAELNQGIYYVEQDGAYYRVETFAGGGIFPMDLFLRWALVLLGVGVGLVGGVSARQGRRRLPAGFAVYGLFLALWVGAGAAFSPFGIGNAPALLAALAGLAATLVAVGATASRRVAIAVAGVAAVPAALGLALWAASVAGFGVGLPFLGSPVVLFVLAALATLVGVGRLGRLGYGYLTDGSNGAGAREA